MKTYKAKSSVKRAIVKDFGQSVFDAGKVVQNSEGNWYFEPVAKLVQLEEASKKVEPIKEPVVEEEKNMVQVEINQSTIGNPCNQVWEMAIEMNAGAKEQGLDAPKRKDVIAACVANGVAFNTARTQYQAWFKASKA